MRGHDRGKTERRTRQRVLRVGGMVLAVALGIVAVWLIVTSDNAQRTKVGALAGFWALLIAAYPVLGMRHPQAAEVGQELDLRPAGRLERSEDAAERMEYERRLQLMVRHEIQQTLGTELSSLRNEVAALRSEILEKVGGQIRLERIETTRMIGSDIEALQHEVRQLKVGNKPGDFGGFTVDTDDLAQSMDDAVARQLAAAEAEHAARLQAAAQTGGVQGGAPQRGEVEAPQPVAVDPVHAVEAFPEDVEPEPEPEPVPRPSEDLFDALPHIAPFTDLEVNGHDTDDESGYAGRRRKPGDAPVLPGGRHAGAEADWATARPGGGRRRREEDGNDILAEILRRESQRQ